MKAIHVSVDEGFERGVVQNLNLDVVGARDGDAREGGDDQ